VYYKNKHHFVSKSHEMLLLVSVHSEFLISAGQ